MQLCVVRQFANNTAMGRKTQITRIQNPTSRQATFSKRRGGLLKKAHDLAVLCDAEVAVIIFSTKGKLFHFASPSMERVLERYVKSCEGLKAPNNNNSYDNVGTESFSHSLEKLQTLQSNHISDDLERCALRDLIHLEQQIHDRLKCVHTKKEELLLKQLEDIREMVTEAQMTRSENSNILKKLLEFGPSEETGSQKSERQGGSEHHCLQKVPQTGSPFPLWELTCEGLLPTTKQPVIIEDLNKLPALMEE